MEFNFDKEHLCPPLDYEFYTCSICGRLLKDDDYYLIMRDGSIICDCIDCQEKWFDEKIEEIHE